MEIERVNDDVGLAVGSCTARVVAKLPNVSKAV